MTSNMNSLKVPDSGLRLMASGGDGLPVPPQAFFLTLEDNAIESMIKAVQSGQEMSLKLGKQPTLKYGSNTHIIEPPSDSLPYDLYLTRPFESTKSADRLPCTNSLFSKPKSPASNVKARAVRDAEKGSDRSKGSSSSGLESDYETLRDGLAAEEALRGRTTIVDKALPTKRGKINGRAFSPNPSSFPSSPALRGVGSPSGPFPSASQQAMERSKYYRVPLVHELAAEDRTIDYLREKWDGPESEMVPALNKIADENSDSKTWTMRRAYYKELDVHSYAYDTGEEREKAIKNAVKIYDKMRLSSQEPEWERLNAPEDRGKGICLSSLQAKIATKEPPAAAPKIKVLKAEDGSASSKEEGSLTDNGKAGQGGENMSRSSSNPLPAKSKKLSAADAQAKRLLSNSKAKPASSTSTPKVSPSKGKGGKAGDGRILSQEIIEDSDVSDDEPAPPAKKKPAVPAVSKTKAKDPESKPRPAVREPAKPAPVKRQREDDDSSSSSGTPLVKRLKGLPLKPKTSQTLQKPSAPAGAPPKAKDTSPRKSSPLASSPPTNVSDMDDATPPPPPPLKKRRVEADKGQMLKQRKRVPAFKDDVMVLTSKFRALYERYLRLHRLIEGSANPNPDDISDLTRMRNRLATMKEKIYGAC